MSMLEEFKKFALKGNAIDMAVGIIIGAAFGTIVNSLVNDIIMPPIGMLIGQVDFSELSYTLGKDADGKAVVIGYGKFINNVINFLIVSFTIFIVIRQMNRIHIPFMGGEEEKPAAPTTKECPFCCSTIPIHASRCPECTSELPPEVSAEGVSTEKT